MIKVLAMCVTQLTGKFYFLFFVSDRYIYICILGNFYFELAQDVKCGIHL